MHSSIDYLIASFVSWIVLSVFIYFALNLDSEEVNARKKMEKKLMESNKNNGNQQRK
jgi:hypothetical protein